MVLCYHGVRSGFEAGISAVPAGRLLRHLEYFLRRGYKYCSDVIGLGEPTTFSLTLDDALSSQIDAWSQPLAEMGTPATLFVPAGCVGAKAKWDYTGRERRHASWTQLAEWIAMGHAIGSHGMDHRDLRYLSDRDLAFEIRGSRELLEDRLGVPVDAFSYPFGRFDARVMKFVREAGYTCAFTARIHRAHIYRYADRYALADCGYHDSFARPRVVVSLLDTELSIEARARRGLWGEIERGKQRLITFWSGGTALRQAWIQRMEKAAA